MYPNFENIILSEKPNKYFDKKNIKIKNKKSDNDNSKIVKLKKKFKIKSTEKTFEDIKFLSNKPNYINFYNSDNNSNINIIGIFLNYDTNFIVNKIKHYKKDQLLKKITNKYIETKQLFHNHFINNDNGSFFINDLNDFCIFHKNNLNQNTNYNILIKFYSENVEECLFIFVDKNKMIKITQIFDYNNICELIEKNKGPFMIKDSNMFYISYGSYTQCANKVENLKKSFFQNTSNLTNDKNFQIISKYQFIKIYFFICNKI